MRLMNTNCERSLGVGLINKICVAPYPILFTISKYISPETPMLVSNIKVFLN